MAGLVLLLGGFVLVAVGAWTVAHPNGGYRAAGGAGSGLEPGTRQAVAYVLGGVGTAMALTGLTSLF